MDKLSLHVSLLHYSKLPIWKGSEIQCWGIFGAIDLLKHLVEEAKDLEEDRKWVLCEMRCVQLSTEDGGICEFADVLKSFTGVIWGFWKQKEGGKGASAWTEMTD